jgi:hypothetical protein
MQKTIKRNKTEVKLSINYYLCENCDHHRVIADIFIIFIIEATNKNVQ